MSINCFSIFAYNGGVNVCKVTKVFVTCTTTLYIERICSENFILHLIRKRKIKRLAISVNPYFDFFVSVLGKVIHEIDSFPFHQKANLLKRKIIIYRIMSGITI